MSDSSNHVLASEDPITIGSGDRDGETSGTTGSGQTVVNVDNPPRDPGGDDDQ